MEFRKIGIGKVIRFVIKCPVSQDKISQKLISIGGFWQIVIAQLESSRQCDPAPADGWCEKYHL